MMKKLFFAFIAAAALCFSASAKPLVVYFSVPESTKTSGLTRNEENSLVVVDGKALGNVQYVADLIADETGADIFRLEAKDAYPTDHTALLNRAAREQRSNARPEIRGKKIVPFTVHGGSGLAGTPRTITRLEPKAQVEQNAFSESRNTVDSCKERVSSWLKNIGEK